MMVPVAEAAALAAAVSSKKRKTPPNVDGNATTAIVTGVLTPTGGIPGTAEGKRAQAIAYVRAQQAVSNAREELAKATSALGWMTHNTFIPLGDGLTQLVCKEETRTRKEISFTVVSEVLKAAGLEEQASTIADALRVRTQPPPGRVKKYVVELDGVSPAASKPTPAHSASSSSSSAASKDKNE
jgi:hypothetical protein